MKKLTLKPITKSQKHSMLAGAGAVLLQIADHAQDIIHLFPSITWVAPVLQVYCLGVTMLSRSIKTDKSGTGTGIINSGPDTGAQEVMSTSAAADTSAAAQAGETVILNALPPKAATDAAETLQLLNVLYPGSVPLPDLSTLLAGATADAKDSLTTHAEMLKTDIGNTPLNINMTQTGIRASDLADGHRAIDAASPPRPPDGHRTLVQESPAPETIAVPYSAPSPDLPAAPVLVLPAHLQAESDAEPQAQLQAQ